MKTLLCGALALGSFTAGAQTLVIDVWGDEEVRWAKTLLPAFNQHYPEINIKFNTIGNNQFIPKMVENFASGQVGDLIMCRPFDESQHWFTKGYFEELTEMEGMENFPSFAQLAWQTDSGAQTYCLPIGSVMHGFFYNKKIFDELKLVEPKTQSEFIATLQRIKEHGKYLPIAFGTKSGWDVLEVGLQNIGPNYWRGEDGRVALIQGDETFDSSSYVAAFKALESWRPYLASNFNELTYDNYWDQFKQGQAAIIPAGSWETSKASDSVELGVFPPPVPDGQKQCFFNEHTDKGIAINKNSPNKDAAMKLLKWMTTKEFASLYVEAEPGFFSLSNHFYDINNDIANEMASWRLQCDSTIRNFAQYLDRGEVSFKKMSQDASVGVIEGTITPEQAAFNVQQGLERWYEPQQILRQKMDQSQFCQ
ncbi:extracellular solute-binding protein [Vibrio sp. SM6]|uniref:Probable sugar-binding periplasmic protein n=1 Tax=Vibrio agarilyticus TaxID=2726741 RepID=A0A7X8TPE5_9VIBR|nr:extracellular solute-binding protein [Vibrio agarilyticus]NLS12522.1 extracellular solute-binding protein [Vibrio agarilyticus]